MRLCIHTISSNPPIHKNKNKKTKTTTYRHIITPLSIMPINALARCILHHNLIQTITHILPDIAIPILIQTHRATRVLQEQVQETHFDVFERGRELRGDVRGDEVRAARVGGQGEGVLGVGCARHECGG